MRERHVILVKLLNFIKTDILQILIVVILFTVTAALGSDMITPISKRFAYWLLMIAPAWFLIATTHRFIVLRAILPKYITLILLIGVNCVLAFPYIFWLTLIISFFYGENIVSFDDLFVKFLSVSLCLSLLNWLFYYHSGSVKKDGNETIIADKKTILTETKLLKRLPIEKHGQLYSLKSADHYLEVQTDKGSELLLMRMKDAVALLGNDAGMQVHRSHWVSFKAMKKIVRENNQYHLLLIDNSERPIGRYYLSKLRKYLSG